MSSNDKYLGLKIPDNYDVRYKTFYADLYDINTKSYLGTCKVMNGVTVDYTRWKDMNNDPDLDLYVGERIAPAGKFKFAVVKKNDLDNNFQIDLLITGTGQVVINWGPEHPTETLELGDTPLAVTNSYDASGEYQIEIDGSAVIDVSLAGTSTGQVSKVLDFGHIGLESVSLYVGGRATYKKIPGKIPPTLKVLPGFCKGMSGLTGTEFQDWDFSHLEDLTGFFSGATASTINIDGKTFEQLTAADQMFASITASVIKVNNCSFAELMTANQLLIGPIGNTIELTNLTFPKLEHAEYWLAGGDHTTVLIDDVEMPALSTEKSLFGETNDCQFTVGTWSTPVLTSSHRTFASYASADPASAKGVTVTGWDMSSITSLNMTFSGHSDCVVSVDLSTCNVDSAHMVFYDSTNVTIVGNDLTIRDGGSLTDMLKSSKGTLDITIQNWTLEDNVTSNNAFGGTSAESGTLNFSGLTVGDNCTVDRACAFTTNLAITADDVTFGNGCALASSFAYMHSGISLHAHNWTIGDGCDLTHMMAFHEGTDVDALQWTIGNECTLTNFAVYYDGTEKPGVRKFNSFTIGTGVTVGIDEMLFAFGKQETLQTRDWTWGNEHIVVNMYSWRVGGSVDATGMSWGTGTQLTRLCNFSTVERIDLTDWTFESVSTDYLLAHIPDTTEVVGVNDWDVANITSLKGFVAHSGFTGLDVSNYDVSNCLDFTETFFEFRPMADLVDFSAWNLSSGELFTSFAGSSGPIKFDMGHLQVHNATNMDTMFAGQTEVITNQDLTCWDVEKIPTQPTGWEQQAIEGGNRLPLWGVPMTDMSRRYHSSCRLPGTPDPLPDIDEPLQFKVESLDGESNTTVSLTVTSTGTAEVHWGDGQISSVLGTNTVTHAYTDPDTHLVEVKGLAVTRVAKGTDNCNVTEIVSFGEIGLVSLRLSPEGEPVTYTVLPNKLSSTMRDLTGLCRGMFGLTDETFAGWDFSKITNLTETWAHIRESELTFTGTALRDVTTVEGTFRGMVDSTIHLIDLQATELTVTDDFARGINRSALDIHRVSMPKLARTGAWLTGSTLSNVTVDTLTLDTATDIDGWLSSAKSSSVEITALVTPMLQTVGQIVGEHTSLGATYRNPDIIFNGWSAAQLVSVGELFSNTADGTFDVNLGSTFNVPSFTVFGKAFFGCKRTNISIPNLTFNAGTEIRQVFGDTEGCYVTATGWNINDGSSMVSTFESDYTGNTFTANGLTGGNGCTISNLSGESIGNTITINEATFGTGLVATNVFSANKGTLTADTWTIGEGANLAGAFSSAAGHGVTAIGWTVGDNADLTGIFMDMFATETSGKSHEFTGWSIGAGSVVTELCKSARDCRIDVSNWAFGGSAELTEMCSGATNLYLTFRNLFVNSNLSLLNAFDSSHDCTLDAYQWSTERAVSLENAFSNATNLTLLELDSLVSFSRRVNSYKNTFRDSTIVNIADIRDWYLAGATDLSGMFANTNPLLPIDYITNFDLSGATNTSEMFWGSGSIMVDLGHWQVGSVTNMTNMFSVGAVSEYAQNFTCWDVESVPTRPTGWAILVVKSLIEEPLWGQPMSDSTGRTHGFCKLPDVLPPVSEDDLMFKFGLPVESKIYRIPNVGGGRGGPDGPDGPVLQSMGVRNVLADEDWLVLSTVSSGRLYIELKVDTTSETTINWGDGESETITTSTVVSHLYSGLDTRDITISGTAVTQVEIVSQPEDGQVTEINSFGLIGLKALHLTNRDANLPPSYNVVPKTLPATIEDLSGFLAGFHNVTNETIGQWDFSNVKYLDGFLARGYNHDLTFENITFTNLVSMSYSLLGNAKSNIRFINCKFPAVTRLENMMPDSYMTNLSMTDCNYPLVTKVSDFVKSCNLCNVTLDGLTLDVADRLDDFLGVTYDTNVSINNLKTPRLSEVTGAFSRQLTSNNVGDIGDPELQLMSVSEVEPDRFVTSVTNWDTPNLREARNLFSGSNFHDITLSFKSHGLFHLDGPWAFTNDCNVTCTDMTFGNDVTVSSLFAGNQWNNYDLRDWTFGTDCEVKTRQILE